MFHRIDRYLSLCLALMAGALSAAPAGADGVEYEQLLVFRQPGLSQVDRVFEASQLPEILRVAREMDVAVHVLDAGEGAPKSVGITPLVVYQNHRGRSIYQGRTTTPGRVKHFIRTSRFVPQGDAVNRRTDIPVRTAGRSRIWAPIKISSVTGTPPADYDDAAFKSEAMAAVLEGLSGYERRDAVELGRSDRGFYMDFYPWRAGDGTLFLSLALYSQFHCKEPVFETKSEPLVGPWSRRRDLFTKGAALLAEAVERQIRSPETGDAFDPVAESVPVADWSSIGFTLPPAPPRQESAPAAEVALVRRWVLAQGEPDAPPVIQFRFAPPLDQYAGEVTSATGGLTLAEGLALDGAAGHVAVDTRKAVTMGEPVLDEAIQGSLMLNTRHHPSARFDIESVESQEAVAFGRLTPALVRGTLVLKGTAVRLDCPSEFEPVVGDQGAPRLIARTSFRIDLREFDIEGADGPAPARHQLLFDVHLVFRPAPPG